MYMYMFVCMYSLIITLVHVCVRQDASRETID